ncbi:putative arginine ABC transporter, permease protein ArtQ [Aedoeadaptatus coxii]|uniref:amino acid ABC transporter permease n=1 Tax=Aedoeadaptatus coxii TaxID=755172 RepID=UPI00177273E3|nr:amino acid ABC transporter permease [Peptoniphilus coxii]CAC9929646.1 putative arginine ABC transporter, permease protein ArtQ [Peptoniphilus coxii]
MDFDFAFCSRIFPKLLVKIPYTLFLGCLAFLIAFVFGLILELVSSSKNKIFSGFAKVYISYFRSTPYITQLFIFYFGLPQLFEPMKHVTAETALIVTVAMNSSAFISEIIRGGLLSVDKNQKEAAKACGMSMYQIYKEIILPQAFVYAFPALGNTFIMMIKNTAIGFTIGVVDILAQAKIYASSSLKFFEAYIIVGLVYWVVLLSVSRLLKIAEKRICVFM